MAMAAAALWRRAVAARAMVMAAMAMATASGGTAARQHNTHAVSTYVCGQLSNMCAGKEGGKGNAPAMRAV